MRRKYLTTKQVMDKYNKTYTQVRYATETKRLKAIKMGWSWVYPENELPPEWPDTPRKYVREVPSERG